MSSKKKAAWSKQKAEFMSSLGGMDDLFAREDERCTRAQQEKEEARRNKTCESKNRYDTRGEAEEVIADRARHGVRGLQSYECPYCGGWHLTSHPWDN